MADKRLDVANLFFRLLAAFAKLPNNERVRLIDHTIVALAGVLWLSVIAIAIGRLAIENPETVAMASSQAFGITLGVVLGALLLCEITCRRLIFPY